MGWKGTVRSLGAVARAVERDAKRKQKELEKQRKQYEKMQDLDQAIYEVDVYENYIEVIQSIHKECSPLVNWGKISSSKPPKKPNTVHSNEDAAKFKLYNYKPGLLERIFKKDIKKRKLLLEEISSAIKNDETQYKSRFFSWEVEVEDWKENVELAKALLENKAEAKIEAIEKLQPFSEIDKLGSSLSISVHENGLFEATIHVHSADLVPNKVKSLLKSGKLSVKAMPKGKFNEIYQDYVCSCVLRIVNELFCAIPDNLVIVTAVDELLNTKTGHLEESPILSVVASRDTTKNLNLDTLDPSDAMSNFVHNMSFKKTKGFEKVERIVAGSLEIA